MCNVCVGVRDDNKHGDKSVTITYSCGVARVEVYARVHSLSLSTHYSCLAFIPYLLM